MSSHRILQPISKLQILKFNKKKWFSQKKLTKKSITNKQTTLIKLFCLIRKFMTIRICRFRIGWWIRWVRYISITFYDRITINKEFFPIIRYKMWKKCSQSFNIARSWLFSFTNKWSANWDAPRPCKCIKIYYGLWRPAARQSLTRVICNYKNNSL